MSATGPDGRGCVVAVGEDSPVVVVLAVDVPLLLDEHAASASAAHTTKAVAVIGVVRLRM